MTLFFIGFHFTYNESVEKPPQRPSGMIFGGRLTFPSHEIVDCSAFCEVTFSRIARKNLLGDFFYSLNDKGEAAATHPKNEAWLFTLASTHLLAWILFNYSSCSIADPQTAHRRNQLNPVHRQL
jgi:hypothetical protein